MIKGGLIGQLSPDRNRARNLPGATLPKTSSPGTSAHRLSLCAPRMFDGSLALPPTRGLSRWHHAHINQGDPMRIHTWCTGTAAALLVIALPAAAMAQDCWGCYTTGWDPELGIFVHEDFVDWGVLVSPPDWAHASKGAGCCYCVHEEGCPADEQQEQQEEQLDLLELESAVLHGEAALVAVHLARGGERLLVNSDRTAIQILSCRDGSVVANHLQMDRRMFDAVLSSLDGLQPGAAPDDRVAVVSPGKR